MDVREAVERVCEIAERRIDRGAVARTKRRQAAVFARQNPDCLPMSFSRPVGELEGLPAYDWEEQFLDPLKSFVMQMRGQIPAAASGSDHLPSLRADTGVVNGPALFGVEVRVPKHTRPVVCRFQPKEFLAEFTLPDDVSELGVTPRIVEHMESHRETLRAHGLDDRVFLFHCDTQGPFDIAHQARGPEIFTDLYEDPDFVHHLMEQSTRAFVSLATLCKHLAGEAMTAGNAKHYWSESGSVCVCDDSGILLPEAVFAEFCPAYMARAFEPFGGGYIHYCGGVPQGGRGEGLHLHDRYCAIPGVKMLNFTTGKDLSAEIRRINARNVAFLGRSVPGGLSRRQDEPIEAYFRRILDMFGEPKDGIASLAVHADEVDEAMDLWERLNSERFG